MRKLLFIMMFLTTTHSLSASICAPSMSINECRAKVTEILNPNDFDKKLALKSADAQIASNNTGGVGKGSGTTTDDFVSKLLSSFVLEDIDNDSDSGFQLEWTNPVGELPLGHAYKVTMSAEPAEVFDPLSATINDEAVTASLGKDLNVMDNLTFGLRYSISNKRFGRDIQKHQNIFNAVFATEIDSPNLSLDDAEIKWRQVKKLAYVYVKLDQDVKVVDLKYTDYTTNIANSGIMFLTECIRLDLIRQTVVDADRNNGLSDDHIREKCFDSLKDQALIAAEEIRTADENYLKDLDNRLDNGDYAKLISLLNNQPQLVFSASGTAKDDIVGPDEYSISFRWEQGFTSLNTLTRSCKHIRHTLDNGTYNLAFQSCLIQKLGSIPEKSISTNNRMFVSLEYSRRDDFKKDFGTPSMNFSFDGTESLMVEAGYGRYLSFAKDGSGQSRIDFSASYEFVYGEDKTLPADQKKNERAKLNLVFSRKLMGDLVGTFGVSYANKAEYLENVDEELSANIGVTYKFAQDKKF